MNWPVQNNTPLNAASFNFGSNSGAPSLKFNTAQLSTNEPSWSLFSPEGYNKNSFNFGQGTGLGGNQNNMFGLPLGNNLGTWNLGLNALMGGFNIWNGLQANRLAKDSFNFNKRMAETNLSNQVQNYNTQLESKARNAAIYRGEDPNSDRVNNYIDNNRARK